MIMTVEEQKTLNFCRNILIIIRAETSYERAFKLISMREPTNDFERAFKEGGLYYLAFWWDKLDEYVFKPELVLSEPTYMPGVIASIPYVKEGRDVLLEQRELAIPQWLEYNIYTEGCNSVC